MFKRFALTGALVAGLATGALAVDVPKDVNGCLDTSLELFKSASGANLSSGDQSKVEQLLGKMEGHCDAKQFADAQTVANDVSSVIGN
ncbi:MAG: hypothetical protein K0U34_04660 [Alphaproteobacteria bacterium]|nr:hypothetical protein [Alphaproteobacteria bacterium]